MCQLVQNPAKGILRECCDVEFANLEQMVKSARNALKVRDELVDNAIGMLYVFWVVSDQDIVQQLKLDLKLARQAMLFIAGQLRDQVTLLQDNARGWIMRLRWPFEGVNGS